MNISRPTLLIIAGAVLMTGSVFLALRIAGGLSGLDDIPVVATSKSDIERIVRNYLLENPEIIFEAAKRMEQKDAEQQLSQMRDAGKQQSADLYYSDDAIVAGNPAGDVTIVEFFDYRCTYCRKIVGDVARLLKQDGNIKLVLKEFPILSKESDAAARAAIASVPQGKYWEFHQALMDAEELSDESIFAIARRVGLNVERLRADMRSPRVMETIVKTQGLAKKLGINATPTFFIGDEPFSGARPLDELKEAVAAARKKA